MIRNFVGLGDQRLDCGLTKRDLSMAGWPRIFLGLDGTRVLLDDQELVYGVITRDLSKTE